MESGYYDIAQVCHNGHVISAMAGSSHEFREKYCSKCGEASIMACTNCNEHIPGHYHVPGVIGFHKYDPPAFCHNCGKPFPWTERKEQAAIDLFVDEIQDKEERRVFEESIKQLSKDTPQAKVAANRITKLVGKLAAGTGEVVKKLVIDVASETIKKTIFH